MHSKAGTVLTDSIIQSTELSAIVSRPLHKGTCTSTYNYNYKILTHGTKTIEFLSWTLQYKDDSFTIDKEIVVKEKKALHL